MFWCMFFIYLFIYYETRTKVHEKEIQKKTSHGAYIVHNWLYIWPRKPKLLHCCEFGRQYQCNGLSEKARLWNVVLCVKWDIKLNSVSLFCFGILHSTGYILHALIANYDATRVRDVITPTTVLKLMMEFLLSGWKCFYFSQQVKFWL